MYANTLSHKVPLTRFSPVFCDPTGANVRRPGVQNALVAVGYYTAEVDIDGDFDPSNNAGGDAAAGVVIGFNELLEYATAEVDKKVVGIVRPGDCPHPRWCQ